MSETIENAGAEHTGLANCACSACTGPDPYLYVENLDASADPLAGTIGSNGKPIWSPDAIAAHLNRTGANWIGTVNPAPQRGDADPMTITYGFFESQAELVTNGYVYFLNGQGFGLAEYFNFATFTQAQRAAAREAIQSWDDVAAITFVETNASNADINFGNLASAPTTQAYSRLPFGTVSSNPIVNDQAKWIVGDVWISASQASNFHLDEGGYGLQTLTHEIGHSLGLSHPGAYNAAPGLSITYPVNAEYYQDTRAYTVMSYFNASSIGARHFDFHISQTVYSGVPLVHDILAIQLMYGADMTTRTGDTVYGFNSNAGRDSFDFTLTPAPIMAIWDAGGTDTLDASGYHTDQIIDLRQGALSSIGGVTYDTAPSYEQVNANRAAQGLGPVPLATYLSNMAALAANPAVGRLTDNVGIAYGAVIENAVGGHGNDLLIGNDSDNVLQGNAGDDGLTGDAGNDTLDGGTGADTMIGGTGSDFYYVDDEGDLVLELIDEGTDTVSSSISHTLAANVENLILTGAATHGTGNELDNILQGNSLGNRLDGGAGADTLIGGDGVDYLTGGAGADIFVAEINGQKVSSKDGPISLDVVLDFQRGVDKIDLSFLDANSNVDGHQAFTWKGHAANKNAGDLSIKTFGNMNAAEKALGMEIDGVDGTSPYAGPVTVVFANTDGGAPEMAMVFVNTETLGAQDFLFG